MEQEVHVRREDIIKFLRNGFLLALLISVLAASSVYFLRRNVPPTYKTRAALYVGESVIDMRSLGLSFLVSPALHVNAYSLAAVSDSVIRAALESLGRTAPTDGDLTAARRRLSVSTDSQSRIVYLETTGPTGEEAAALTNALAHSLMSWDAQRPKDNLMQAISGLQQRIAVLDLQIAGAAVTAGEPPGQANSLVALRDEQVSQLATAVMLSDSVIGRLEQIEAAAVPQTPVAPSPASDGVIGGLVAFLVAYLGLLIRALLNPRVRSLEEVAFHTGVPILAAYPALPKPTHRLPPVPTSFLRAALTPTGDSTKVILMTSVENNRAASRLSIGLAESFALSGFSTLLIGSTGNSEEIRERFSLPPRSTVRFQSGSTETPTPNSPVLIPVQHEQGAVLTIMPGLEPTAIASEKLASILKNNLRAWKQAHQIIVIDTPSIFGTADALTLTKYADDVVIVVDKRLALRKELSAAADILRRHGASISGSVVTNVPTNQLGPEEYGSLSSPFARLSVAATRS